jgi:flagellar hook-basal body protein
MGLSTALYAGISGLERQQTNLDVIGSNIANVNTYGYKSQRVLFNDMLYNTLKSGTAPSGVSAGTNPSQVGSGVDISVIDTNFNAGDLETTGIASDMAIEGNGFFVLGDGNEQVFTRDGAFSLSQDRRLVSGSTGMAVQGWVQTRDNSGQSTINTGGAITDVVIPVGDNRIAQATSEVILNGNLNNAGTVATTGTILNSQRLFTSTSDVEVGSGTVDLRDLYIKDPAGGVDNVRLFKGSGGDATTGDNNVLTAGDEITVQITKGGRPLEAIFVYGDGDLVDNASGARAPDGTPDFGLESYDGTTLDNFMSWFDEAFGLHRVEAQGTSPDDNASHGTDGDNPNDLVDMGFDSTTPFTDETDADGFQFVVASIGAASGGVVPKVAYQGGEKEFNVVAGASSDVGIGNSFIDIDEDGAYNADKDIMLEGTESFVANSVASVTKGYQPNSPQALLVRAFHDSATGASLNPKMAYIDVDGSGVYNADADILIREDETAGTDFIANVAANGLSTAGNTTLETNGTLTNSTDDLSGVAIGQFFVFNNQEYYVENIASATVGGTTTYTVTLDRTMDATYAGEALQFQGVNLATLGYTVSTSSAAGSTVVSSLNLPKGQKVDNKYQGINVMDVTTDNEAGAAGSVFTGGDATVRVATDVDGTTKYAYIDADGDGTHDELVYTVGHDGTNLTLDSDGDATADVSVASTLTDLTAFADNEQVFVDSSNGNIYRKVPKIYASAENQVYLDKGNKGTYDEVRFNIVYAGSDADANADQVADNAAGQHLWVVDEDNDGLYDEGENTVLSTAQTLGTSATAGLNRPSGSAINGETTGSGRIQIRGNIGVSNELSDISFMSGVDKTERNLFGASALADASGHGYSIAATADGESVSQNIVVYDSLGKSHDVTVTFVLEAQDNDKATFRWFAETADVSRKTGIFPAGDPRGQAPSVNVGSGTVQFDNFGRFLRSSGATENSEALFAIPLEGMDTDSTLNIKPDFSILTAFADVNGSSVDVREQDGFAQGVMDRYSVNADGTVTGIYTNGLTEVVAQVALAAFANPDGLTRAGGNLFKVGSNSGNAMIGAAMSGERGAVRGESLELSNVDVTQEFTNMITTQRAYQANARVVTKSDELLQELMQIIR